MLWKKKKTGTIGRKRKKGQKGGADRNKKGLPALDRIILSKQMALHLALSDQMVQQDKES